MTGEELRRCESAVDRARRVADEVLFPNALVTDQATRVPSENFEAIAEAGLFGVAAAREHGGLELPPPYATDVVEILAGGCLTTAFVWIQHHALLRALGRADTSLRDAWIKDLANGHRTAGVVFGGLLPGPPKVTARETSGGWELHGAAEWVTGWGLVEVLLVMARTEDQRLVSVVVDAAEQHGITPTSQQLVAANASGTVHLSLDGLRVGHDRTIAVDPYDPAFYNAAPALRYNGSLALGVASRANRLLPDGPFSDELSACRQALDEAVEVEAMCDARAGASHLALRATADLLVADGGRGLTPAGHAQPLMRETMLLMVFGSRPDIKSSLHTRIRSTATHAGMPTG